MRRKIIKSDEKNQHRRKIKSDSYVVTEGKHMDDGSVIDSKQSGNDV